MRDLLKEVQTIDHFYAMRTLTHAGGPFHAQLVPFYLGTGIKELSPLIICFALESPAAMENSRTSLRTHPPDCSDSTCSVYVAA